MCGKQPRPNSEEGDCLRSKIRKYINSQFYCNVFLKRIHDNIL